MTLQIARALVLCVLVFPISVSIGFTWTTDYFPLQLWVPSLGWSGVKLFSLAIAQSPGPNPSFGGIILVVFAGLAWLTRDGVAFVFFATHLVLAFVAVSLDLVGHIALDDRTLLVEQAALFSLIVIALSQVAFLMFLSRSPGAIFRLFASVVVSATAYVVGVFVLCGVAQVADGALLVFAAYLILSYGVFGMHVMSLTFLLGKAEPGLAVGWSQ